MAEKILCYMPTGGSKYPVDFGNENDTYFEKENAIAEWKRRRNDISGQFPFWGGNVDEPAILEITYKVNAVTEEVTSGYMSCNAWSARAIIPADELFHYYD